MKTLKYLIIAILLVGQVSCVDDKLEKDFKITISPDAVVNKINVEIIDAFTFLPVDATAVISGDNAKYVYNEAGKRTEVTGGYELDIVDGAVSFGVERKANASEENPVNVTLTISATGYADKVIEVTFDGADEAQRYPVALLPTLPSLPPVAPKFGKANDFFGATDVECSVPDETVVFSFTNNSLTVTLMAYLYDDGDTPFAAIAIEAPIGSYSITAEDIRTDGFYEDLRPLLDSELELSLKRIDESTWPPTGITILEKQQISVCSIIENNTPLEEDVSSGEATTEYDLDLTISCSKVAVALNGYDVSYRKAGAPNYEYFQTIQDGKIQGTGPVLEDNTIYQFRVIYDSVERETPASGDNAITGADVKESGVNLDQNGLCNEVSKYLN